MLLYGIVAISVFVIDCYRSDGTSKDDVSRDKNNFHRLRELQGQLNHMERSEKIVQFDLNNLELSLVNRLCFLRFHQLSELTLTSVSLNDLQFLSINIPESVKLLHIYFQSTYKSILILKTEMLQMFPTRNVKIILYDLNNVIVDPKVLNGNNIIHLTPGNTQQHHLSVLQHTDDLYKTKKRWNCNKLSSMKDYCNIEVNCSNSFVHLTGRNISGDLVLFYQTTDIVPVRKILDHIYFNSATLMKYQNAYNVNFQCLFNSTRGHRQIGGGFVKENDGTLPNFVTFKISSYNDLLYFIDMIKSSLRNKSDQENNCRSGQKTYRHFATAQLVLIIITFLLVYVLYVSMANMIFYPKGIAPTQDEPEDNRRYVEVPTTLDEHRRERERIRRKISDGLEKSPKKKTDEYEGKYRDLKGEKSASVPSLRKESSDKFTTNSKVTVIYHRKLSSDPNPQAPEPILRTPKESSVKDKSLKHRTDQRSGRNSSVTNRSATRRSVPRPSSFQRRPPNASTVPRQATNRRSMAKLTGTRGSISFTGGPSTNRKSLILKSLEKSKNSILPALSRLVTQQLSGIAPMRNPLLEGIRSHVSQMLPQSQRPPLDNPLSSHVDVGRTQQIVHGSEVFHPHESTAARPKSPKVIPFTGRSNRLNES